MIERIPAPLSVQHLPVAFLEASFEDYDIGLDPANVPAYQAVVAWQKTAFEILRKDYPRRIPKSLILMGEPRRAKTLLACALLRFFADRGFRAAFITMETYLRMQRQRMDLTPMVRMGDMPAFERYEEIEKRTEGVLEERAILVLDDVGRSYSSGSGYGEAEIDYILRSRWEHGLVTIITSNQTLEWWRANYPNSVVAFLKDLYEIIEFV